MKPAPASPSPRASTATAPSQAISDRLAWITWIAFLLALTLTAVRATMLETERDAFFSADVANGPGAGTSLVLDLLSWVPLLLILFRRAIDTTYVLRLHWSHLILGAMALWMGASVNWSGDKFLALIGASKWISGLAILFAMSQLVRSWQRFRITAGIGVGLLALYAAQAAYFKTVEFPQTIKDWHANKADWIANGTMTPTTAEMFEKKLLAGEMLGFFSSANSFAAIMALCGFVAIGVAIQRWKDRDEIGFPITILIIIAAGAVATMLCDSRTALGGILLGAILLALVLRYRDRIAAHSKTAYLAGLLIILVGWLGVIGIGLKTGGLVQKSLTFRWWYWKGSLEVVKQHPILGVGFKNFSYPYLAHRVPTAMEEIKDPHNIIVRFFVELGVVGGMLLILWLLRVSWELTRPVVPAPTIARKAESILPVMGWLFCLTLLAGLLCQTSLMLSDTTTGMKMIFFDLLLVAGLALTIARSSTHMTIDDRPAPYALAGMLVGLAGFLLHSFVDFAWSEAGIGMVVAVFVGAILGLRHQGVAGKKPQTLLAIMWLGVLFFALLAYGATIVWRVNVAESYARDAGVLAKDGKHLEAASQYELATLSCPVSNVDYLSRRVRELTAVPGRLTEALALCGQVIGLNPSDSSAYLDRAHLLRQLDRPDDALADYRQAVDRNPVDWRVRVEFAQYLDQLNHRAEAAAQLSEALRYNALLPPDEIRAMPADLVGQIQARLRQP